jgi:hypothetical protein
MNNAHDENPRTIFATMMKVQSDLARTGISKDQKNSQQGWKFRGIDAVLNALSGVLAENKALIIPDVIDKQKLDSPKGSHWLVTVNWMMLDKYGDSLVSRHCGEAIDYGDKGLNKAITSSYKYFLFSAFCIPLIAQEFGDADEASPGEEEEEQKPQKSSRKSVPKKKASVKKLAVVDKKPASEIKSAQKEFEKLIGYTSTMVKDADENGAAKFETNIDVDMDGLRTATIEIKDKYPELKKKLNGLGLGYAEIIRHIEKQKNETSKQVAG